MKKFILCSLISFCGLFLASCSTIMHGTNQKVGIASNPSSADVWIDQKLMGTTPVCVKLPRNKNHTVSIQLDGYKPFEMILEKNISAWVLGNIVFGGFIGVGVDAVSGGIYKLEPNQINALLCKENIFHPDQNADFCAEVENNAGSDLEQVCKID